MTTGDFHFESFGIGELLRRTRLHVPPNQRPYAWDEIHVRTLLEDLHDAITRDDRDYFLGTIVLVKSDDGPAIADGQQRLATTSILLTKLRDKQVELGRVRRAEAIDTSFLKSVDMDTEEVVPQLRLNEEDHQFYLRHILGGEKAPRNKRRSSSSPSRPSNQRLLNAAHVVEDFLEDLLSSQKQEYHSDVLNRWVTFIKNGATVVVVTASDDVGAYRMFETLNDRGVQASQADILKNYLFSKAGSRLSEAQAYWQEILGSIETLPDDVDQRLVTFIRHLWVLTYGPTKERELAARIKAKITGETRALNFLSEAAEAVEEYVALWSSQHPVWARHHPPSRRSIDTIALHLQVEQIRPLLFAVVRFFSPEEAEKALRLCVSWSVRFLIYGGRGGLLDHQYSLRAQEIGTRRITTAKELLDAMERYVPTDAEFEAAFATARVSRPRFARYYLRALENRLKGDKTPELVDNEDVSQIAIDHVLPLAPGDSWNVSAEEAEATQKLLGNMVLLRARDSRELGSTSFLEKRECYATSGYITTNMVARESHWTVGQIRTRQEELARLAVDTWPTRLN